MRAGRLIRQAQRLAAADATACPSCGHSLGDHYELGYGVEGHQAGVFHCRHDGCGCTVNPHGGYTQPDAKGETTMAKNQQPEEPAVPPQAAPEAPAPDRAGQDAPAAEKPAGGGTQAAAPEGRLSTLAAAEKVLAKAGKPLHASVITERIMKLPGVRLAGKTPAQTVAAALAVAAKKGGRIERTAPNTFTLKRPSGPTKGS